MDTLRTKATAWLAWTLCALIVVSALVGMAWAFADLAGRPVTVTALEAAMYSGLAIPFAVVAALIITRQPRNLVGWLLLLPALVLAVGPFINRYLASFPEPPAEISLALYVLIWFAGWAWLLLIFPLLLIPLYFPTGRPPGPRWRWLGAAMAVQALVFVFIVTFSSELTPVSADDVTWSVPNPIGFLSAGQMEPIFGPFVVVLLGMTLLCVASLFARYRRAGAVERTQIRWLLYACAFFAFVYVAFGILPVDAVDGERTPLGYVWDLVFVLSVATIPAAIAIAILRYRLYDIDVIIRRTLIYSVFTGLLAALYLGTVIILSNVLRLVTGQAQSQLVTVLSTLVIAALFVPVRSRVQRTIDRRFYRRKYDMARTLAGFAAGARDEVELERLSSRLVAVVEETMQPASVGLWLRKGEGK